MKNISWLMVLGSAALLLTAPACGSDDSSGSGGSGTGGANTGGASGSGTGGMAGTGTGGMAGAAGSTGTHQTCTDAAAKVKSLADALSCTDTSTNIQAMCEQLYATNTCVTEFETFLGCAATKANTDWECTADGPDLKAGVCDTEGTAFATCTGN